MVEVVDKERQALDPKLKAILEDEEATKAFVYCAQCSYVLARADAGIEVHGSHAHFCTNPHGFQFHLRCFKEALGCAISGQPTAADSWFPTYRWRFASCGECQTHLGWFFESAEHHFFGLIRDRIQVED